MPITEVDSHYFHDQRERLENQRANDLAETPWTPLPKPLSECNVTLVSTAGIFLKSDESFDYDRERAEPSWGDPSYREIPRTAGQDDVEYSHLHIDTSFLKKDRNVAWPVDIFEDYEREGVIGHLADTLYSIMGYIPNYNPLLKRTAPLMIEKMKSEGVDAAFIVPV
jgi:D-proline reductase (dithiol) PrdB